MSITNDGYQYMKYDLYDLYMCESAVDEEAIIYCHGGAFRYGNKEDNHCFLAALGNKLSMRVYSIDFRNIDEARFVKTMIDDINYSINSIVKNDKISRFHIMGSSSGAYLVWILSIMLSNPSKYNISFDYEVVTVTLISGYLLFKENDPITRMLCLFPAFQSFPKDIKNVDMDYSDYTLPPILLITGEDDDCLEDSKTLYEAVQKTNNTDISMNVFTTNTDKADHCFLIENPEIGISKQAFESIRFFIMRIN